MQQGRKLTDEQIREMRIKRAEGTQLKVLAYHFGVNISTIWHVLAGRRYKDVK